MAVAKWSMPKPIGAVIECASDGHFPEAVGMAMAASGVAFGSLVYMAIAAGLLGLGIRNSIESHSDRRKVQDLALQLKGIADQHGGSLRNAAEHMRSHARKSELALDFTYSNLDNPDVIFFDIFTAKHDELAESLKKHEGFYVSLAEFLEKSFDEIRSQLGLAETDRAQLKAILNSHGAALARLEARQNQQATRDDLTALRAEVMVQNDAILTETRQAVDLLQRVLLGDAYAPVLGYVSLYDESERCQAVYECRCRVIPIGRGPHANGISLSGDPAVSTAHAIITLCDDGFCLHDRSLNGTDLGHAMLRREEVKLGFGDSFRIGEVLFRVTSPASQKPAPSATVPKNPG